MLHLCRCTFSLKGADAVSCAAPKRQKKAAAKGKENASRPQAEQAARQLSPHSPSPAPASPHTQADTFPVSMPELLETMLLLLLICNDRLCQSKTSAGCAGAPGSA